ncbi:MULTISPECIES: carboxymuconolactone decarboxylase family protein [Maritimibacter]|jgi:4-carboxymuconolactone decarboxylase|uniref:4-carboxymuconolactone decarboxylase, putative n=1 Tax=Maritimibacter alkaliphilus HTCC2654 TaxID=314271 RepID=A3VIA5_9RHOB|nr:MULTISPECIES: carboxymuconolactone decarboxylase family protein [Maritimibacter]EAQ12104.1 4-carboxymuconolactone decarboxylase, putative [Rhodobacterales bacterium HTCC2654] [Maritimibacter alkaliphilus HTCC2654]MBL6426190.1 carboxymuconolactone decarboxylase family protein [Maritimibacter sp.]MCR9077352.1 carboxymuconolactone decarboxylase family protein [bacterium]TYP83155.1 4-carboxymuconolactone decarboxylase [Maritimibacter alkaliphilus HTCC2654]
MSDFTKTYARMMEQGTAMLKAFNPMLEDFTPEGFDKLWPTMPRDWMEAMFGNSFNPDGLDAKTRLMVLLGGLVATGATQDSQIKYTVRHLMEAGATQKEIGEVIYQMSMLGGLPAMNHALELAQEVYDAQKDDEEGDA